MSSTFPPDAWSVTAGTWGTDIDRDESNSGSGSHAIEFKNLAVTGSAVSITSRHIPVEGDTVQYAVMAWLRNAANKGFAVKVESFTQAGVSLGVTTLFTGAEDLKGVYVAKGGVVTFGSTARTAIIIVEQATQDYQLLLDRVEAYALPRHVEAQVESNYTLATATAGTVEYKYQSGNGIVWDDSQFTALIPRHGVYLIQAAVQWDTMASELCIAKVQKDDGAGGWTDLDFLPVADVQTDHAMLLSTALYIEQGKLVRIRLIQSGGGGVTRTIQGSASVAVTWLRITELRG